MKREEETETAAVVAVEIQEKKETGVAVMPHSEHALTRDHFAYRRVYLDTRPMYARQVRLLYEPFCLKEHAFIPVTPVLDEPVPDGCDTLVTFSPSFRSRHIALSRDRATAMGPTAMQALGFTTEGNGIGAGHRLIMASHAVAQGSYYCEIWIRSPWPSNSKNASVRLGVTRSMASMHGPIGMDNYGYGWCQTGERVQASQRQVLPESHPNKLPEFHVNDVIGFMLHLPEPKSPEWKKCYMETKGRSSAHTIRYKGQWYLEESLPKQNADGSLLQNVPFGLVDAYLNGKYVGRVVDRLPCIASIEHLANDQDRQDWYRSYMYTIAVSLYGGARVTINPGPLWWFAPETLFTLLTPWTNGSENNFPTKSEETVEEMPVPPAVDSATRNGSQATTVRRSTPGAVPVSTLIATTLAQTAPVHFRQRSEIANNAASTQSSDGRVPFPGYGQGRAARPGIYVYQHSAQRAPVWLQSSRVPAPQYPLDQEEDEVWSDPDQELFDPTGRTLSSVVTPLAERATDRSVLETVEDVLDVVERAVHLAVQDMESETRSVITQPLQQKKSHAPPSGPSACASATLH